MSNPLKTRTAADYTAAYQRGTELFIDKGFHPRFERLDNKTSDQLEAYCKSQNITIQYVPPGMHRTNREERAIRTWKNHFISVLSGLDPDFPLSAWDELLPQAEMS